MKCTNSQENIQKSVKGSKRHIFCVVVLQKYSSLRELFNSTNTDDQVGNYELQFQVAIEN